MSIMKDRPNILVIMSDQHNKHMLGCYGNDLVRTPNIDALAGEGIVYDSAYCPSPLCVPGRMSFMTSRTPSGNQVWNNTHILSSAIPTWAHHLGAAGYETALIGRMHFIGPDQRHGFEKRPFGDISSPYPGLLNPGGWMGKYYSKGSTGQSRSAVEVAGKGSTFYQWYDEQVTQKACEYIKEKSTQRDRPFAAVVGCVLPHNPYIAPKELFDYYYERVDIPELDADQPEAIRTYRENRNILNPYLSEKQVRSARAAYFALCEYFDTLLGNLIGTLRDTGLLDNTIVIYTSDHGDSAGEHQCWCKRNYYEGSASVPLIIRYPDQISAGRCDAVCNLTDIGPTLVEIAEAPPMKNISGKSLWPLITSKSSADDHTETICELIDSIYASPPVASAMIRHNQWKLSEFHDGDDNYFTLHNLKDDPDERNDLSDDSEYSQIKQELHLKLRSKWNPEDVIKRTKQLDSESEIFVKWAQNTKPVHPDSITMPDPSIEKDVELIN